METGNRAVPSWRRSGDSPVCGGLRWSAETRFGMPEHSAQL